MEIWRNCSSCKKGIPLGAAYQKCNVSSCRKQVFCSVNCWSLHDEIMGHKSAWAEEEKAPLNKGDEKKPRRRIVAGSSAGKPVNYPMDILIVASKLKDYVKQKHDMNTSANVMEKLSDIVR